MMLAAVPAARRSVFGQSAEKILLHCTNESTPLQLLNHLDDEIATKFRRLIHDFVGLDLQGESLRDALFVALQQVVSEEPHDGCGVKRGRNTTRGSLFGRSTERAVKPRLLGEEEV